MGKAKASASVKTENKRSWGKTHSDGSPIWQDRPGSFRSFGLTAEQQSDIDAIKASNLPAKLKEKQVADIEGQGGVTLEYVDGLADNSGANKAKDLIKINCEKGKGRGISVDQVREILGLSEYLVPYLAEMDKQASDDES